jgi:hypothetical protein
LESLNVSKFGFTVDWVFLVFEVNFETFDELSLGVSLGELFFGSCDNEDRYEETDQSNKWVDKSDNLPHIMVSSISTVEFDQFRSTIFSKYFIDT